MPAESSRSLIDLLPPATCVALFLARSTELAIRRSKVRGSVVAPHTLTGLIASGTLVVACSVAEYFILQRRFAAGLYLVGLLLGVLSFVLRARAAKALGRYWSMQIELRGDQPLVTDGPYAWIRHPVYAAAILEMLAALILCQAAWSAVPALLLFAPFLALRIRLEERAMVGHFGPRYTEYMRSVPALLGFRRSLPAASR
jgi:protein-S-isoprenylcysteine O-methyltransferase Ste14